jgi:hypothetical protein
MVKDTFVGKILGLTKNNDKYKDVPDRLKWAIPAHESATRPEVVAEGRARVARVKQQVEAEMKAERRSKLSTVPRP